MDGVDKVRIRVAAGSWQGYSTSASGTVPVTTPSGARSQHLVTEGCDAVGLTGLAIWKMTTCNVRNVQYAGF